MTHAVEIDTVSKMYRGARWPGRPVHALHSVTLTIEPGEVFALLGPNQAGKSTLLKILLGLCRPSSGQVFRLGQPAADRSTLMRVGYMQEHQAFPRYLTASEVLEFYGALAWVSAAALRVRVPALLERVGLAHRAREPIARFSKGMVQRLALAQALVAAPELLVLDEPMEGLDYDARILLEEVIAEQRHAGHTVLLVSHALGEVAKLCDRLAVLVSGRVVFLDSRAALLHGDEPRGNQSFELAIGSIYHACGSI